MMSAKVPAKYSNNFPHVISTQRRQQRRDDEDDNDEQSQSASSPTWITMNSYPPELLVQLAPVMFVAGLDVPPLSPPEPVPSVPSDSPTPARPAQDPFTALTLRLRDALLSQRSTAIWQPDKSKTFQTVLVEKVCSTLLWAILSA
jgi:hypothetical protein